MQKNGGDPLPYCFAGFLNPSRVGIRRPSELGMVVLHALVLLYVEDHTDFLQDLFTISKHRCIDLYIYTDTIIYYFIIRRKFKSVLHLSIADMDYPKCDHRINWSWTRNKTDKGGRENILCH